MKIGRNAPCPCGSGKKYKKCCLKRGFIEVNPSNNPEIINHHFNSIDGKNWVKQPGRIDFQVHMIDPEDLDDEIDNVFSKIRNHFKDKAENHKLIEKIYDCKHKCCAVKYHRSIIENEIQDRVKEFQNDYNAGSGVKTVKENPKLIYEMESFLFQVKSNLDLLAQVLTFVIHPFNIPGFRKKGKIAGGKVINRLSDGGYQDFADKFEENRKSWIQDMVEMRDTITHYSHLKGFDCFIEEPYLGKKVKIHYPTMPSGERVDEYCERINKRLIELYSDIFDLIEKL